MRAQRFLTLCLSLVALLLVPSICRADSLVLSFNTPNSLNPPAGSGPWATLSLMLNPNATITVDVQAAPGFMLGDFLFNPPGFHGTGLTVSTLPTNWFFFPDGACLTDKIGGSPGLNCFGSDIGNIFVFATPPAPLSDLTFTLTQASGFTSVFNLVNPGVQCPGGICSFIPIRSGPQFAIILENGSGSSVGVAYANVPEPSSLLMLASGLAGVLGAMRRKFVK